MFNYFFVSLLLIFGTGTTHHFQKTNKLNYLALGDSYTIGESVNAEQNFPAQLQQKLSKEFGDVNLRIIAKTGWTTRDLIENIEKENPENKYDLLTLLIGVNNQYQGKDTAEYKTELKFLIEKATALAQGKKENVLLISIPDYGVTPFAKSKKPAKISQEIARFNQIKKTQAEKAGINWIEITEISKLAKTDLTLLADDQLHPSAKMYKMWVEKIAPAALQILKKE